MSNSSDEIMLTLSGQDNASQMFANVDKNAQSMASNISNAMSKVNISLMNLGQVTDNVMQSLTGKSAMENIFATASKAETNNVLLGNMLDDAEKHFDSFYEKVDTTTDNSIVSMQELIPALKAFKSATGATDKEMTNITDEMANFGAAVLAQTGSTDMAQQSMMDLAKGVKGAYASLDQYGITEAALKRTGKWSGDEEDVEGFMAAVTEVTGSTKELMETNQGLDALIGKSFSRAGKKIGNEYLPVIKDIKRSFIDLDTEMGGAIASTMLLGSAGVESANRVFWNVSTTVQGVKDLKDAFGSLKGIFKGAEVVEDAVSEASAIGSVAGEAGAAATGAEATAAATTTLSGAFTSMIVPLLALSAVIAIMIPIAAGLAAEAMFFLKLLADFMAAMNFDNINLDGASKGLQSLTVALLWVGAAMLSLTAVNITTSLAAVTSMFMGLTGPLKEATTALSEAADLLKGFSSVSIDPSVPTNLKAIADSLMAVSGAMAALTWSNIITGFSDWIAGALGFSSATEALSQAKDDIIKASTIINEFSGITPLDESVATNIQNVCDSLASVGNAMAALRGIRDGQNWDDIFGELMTGLFGEGVDIQTALTNVKQDIIDASASLAEFTGITDIPEGVAEKIKKVSDTLTSVNDAFKSLRGMRDDTNWDDWIGGIFGGVDIATALEQVKTDLLTASQKLAELSGLSEISEDTTKKIGLVGDALSKVSEVTSTLTQLPPMEDFDSTIISTAVTNVQNAATELSKLNETTFDGSTADTLLGSIQTTLDNLKNTLSAASGFSEPATSIGSQIISGVQTGLSPLTSTVTGAVTTATSASASAGWTGGSKIGSSTTNGMKSALQLKSTMQTEVSYTLQAMTSRTQEFYNAGAALGKAANDGFKSQPAINPGSPGNLAHVMIDEVGYILDAMKSKYGAAKSMASGLGQSIYQGFGGDGLDFGMFTNGGVLTANHIGALQTTVSKAPDKSDNRPVTIIVEEGAVPIDARNHTTKEAQALMITAFEGMDHITNIDVDGV